MKYFTQWGMVLVCVSTLCLFAACNKDADDALAEAQKLTIETSIEDYLSADGKTRANINGATITFVNGDKIGFFAKKGSSLKYDNLPLTYTGNGQWNSGATPIYYYGDDVTYYAYFPYDASVNGKTIDEIRNGFSVKDNQSTLDNFKASSLMTAVSNYLSSSAIALKLSFVPSHRLLEVIIPDKITGESKLTSSVGATSTYSYNFYKGTDTGKASLSTFYTPASNSKSFYRIVKGGYSTSVKAVDGVVTYSIQDNSAIMGLHSKRTLSSLVKRDLAINDFVYVSNGALAFMPGKTSAAWMNEASEKNDCIGIVVSLGASKLENEPHGLLISKKDISNDNCNGLNAPKIYKDNKAGPLGQDWIWPSISTLAFVITGDVNGGSVAKRDNMSILFADAGGTKMLQPYWSCSFDNTGDFSGFYHRVLSDGTIKKANNGINDGGGRLRLMYAF